MPTWRTRKTTISDSCQHSHGFAPGISIHSKKLMRAQVFVSRGLLAADEAPESDAQAANDGVAGGGGQVRRGLQFDDLLAGMGVELRDFGHTAANLCFQRGTQA